MGLKNRLPLKRVFISILLIGVFALLPVQAVPSSPSEYQVKAAFLYNFAKFVEWPPEVSADNRPFVIGILGQDPFDGFIDETVSGKSVREKRITVKRFSKVEAAAESQILFISESERDNVARIVKQLEHAPVLTVSDIGQFAKEGGMVQLLTEQNRVRFAINVAVIERAGLKPSSQLLKLAQIVGGPMKE